MQIHVSKPWLAVVGAAVLTFAASGPARAVDFGVRAGVVVDDSDPYVGLELLAPIGHPGWYFNPNVEFVDADSGDRLSANLDVHYDFQTGTNYTIWGGAGAAWVHTDAPRGGKDQDDAALNLLGGIGWKLEGMTPYAQIKVVVADDSTIQAGVGIRF
jgi:hypothetical protein